MFGRANFRLELKELNRWKKAAGFYNKTLTDFVKGCVDFYIKYQGKSAIFNQSEYTETTKQNKEMKEMNVKLIKQLELLLTKLNEANQEVKNAKEALEVNQNIATELASIRKLVMSDTHKALEAIPKISSAFDKFQETISNYVGRGGK